MSSMAVICRPVGKRGHLMDVKAVRQEIANLNQAFGKRLKRSFQHTVQTWDHKVTFHQITRVLPDPMVSVFTYDAIYGYITEGTDIRYAVMTPDFSPKTRPGILDSFPGKGGFMRLDMANPRPGIQARRFVELVEEKHGLDYQQAIDAILDRGLQRG